VDGNAGPLRPGSAEIATPIAGYVGFVRDVYLNRAVQNRDGEA
jgi:hypothetical protein